MNRRLPDFNEKIVNVVIYLPHFPFAPRCTFLPCTGNIFLKDSFLPNINHSNKWANVIFSHLKTAGYASVVSGVGFYLALLPLAKFFANGSKNKHACNILMLKGDVKAGKITHPLPRPLEGGEIALFCWQQVQPPECRHLTHHEKYSERETDSESDGQ